MDRFPAMSELAHILTDMPLVMLTLEALATVKVVLNANSLPDLQCQSRINRWTKLFDLRSANSYHTHHLMTRSERECGYLFGCIVPVIQVDI